jgi:predicted transcriptional regulator
VNYLGDKLRNLRESQGLLLRQAAAFVEVDTAFISKVERGEKKASREQVLKLAAFLSADKEQLIILWLCDKIIDVVEDDPMAKEALKMALKNVKTAK